MRPLSRREYDQLVELGAFQNERIELLRGVLVKMSPQGAPHSGITAWFAQKLILLTQGAYEVRSHSPYAADDYSEPEPDVSVSIRNPDAHEHPTSVLLLIEVADSSLRIDRKVKLPIYAEAGAPEYWLVDVNAQTVVVYTKPVDGEYSSIERFHRTGVLKPTTLPGIEIDLAQLHWT